jgi:alpha-beta hydrolase superfamily lysophospholipase
MPAYLSSVKHHTANIDLDFNRVRFVHLWSPNDEQPWGVVTVIHGFGDHGGRFAGMATSLASMGLAVVAVDLIGHGRSPGKRGVIGSYEELLREVELSLGFSNRAWPKIPQFLFGQSMGGNLVLNWLLRRREAPTELRGVVIGSPMLKMRSMPREQIMNAGRWLAKCMPNFRIPASVDVEKLSRDRRAQDAYLRDPWVHRSMSLRLAAELIDSGEWALDNAGMLCVPTLLMHGTEDTLTSPDATAEFARRAGSMAVFQEWSGCRHDLHDEPQREQVFEYMVRWLKGCCVATYKLSMPEGRSIRESDLGSSIANRPLAA